MNLTMLKACIEGYQERMFDMETLAVQQGYWAGYYQSRHPKSPSMVIRNLQRQKDQIKSPKALSEISEEEILQYKEREERLLSQFRG